MFQLPVQNPSNPINLEQAVAYLNSSEFKSILRIPVYPNLLKLAVIPDVINLDQHKLNRNIKILNKDRVPSRQNRRIRDLVEFQDPVSNNYYKTAQDKALISLSEDLRDRLNFCEAHLKNRWSHPELLHSIVRSLELTIRVVPTFLNGDTFSPRLEGRCWKVIRLYRKVKKSLKLRARLSSLNIESRSVLDCYRSPWNRVK